MTATRRTATIVFAGLFFCGFLSRPCAAEIQVEIGPNNP